MPTLHDDVLDAQNDEILNNCSSMIACDRDPTDYADAVAGTLATVNMVPGDFTKAAGDTSGRKVTVASKSAVPVTATGTYDKTVLLDSTGSRVLVVAEGTDQALTANPGATIDFPAWDVENRQAT